MTTTKNTYRANVDRPAIGTVVRLPYCPATELYHVTSATMYNVTANYRAYVQLALVNAPCYTRGAWVDVLEVVL